MVKSIAPQDAAREIVASSKPVLVAFLKGRNLKDQFDLMRRAEARFGSEVTCCLYNQSYLDAGMRQHFVSGTPTYLLFQDGWEVDRLMGRTDDAMLESFLNRCLARDD